MFNSLSTFVVRIINTWASIQFWVQCAIKIPCYNTTTSQRWNCKEEIMKKLMYLPVLSLITLVTWNGMDLSIKIITPLAWEVKGAEYILPCHLLLIFASWLDNRWVSWSSMISECIDFTLVITCFTFFSFCSTPQFQEDILILNPPDIMYNIALASQYIQII